MLGKMRMVENEASRFGADPWYFFLKVQSVAGHEEYWLVTEEEDARFRERGEVNPEDWPRAARGHFICIPNTQGKFGAATHYYAVAVYSREDGNAVWMLTAHDLTRIRERVQANMEDIELNRENWLADLLD